MQETDVSDKKCKLIKIEQAIINIHIVSSAVKVDALLDVWPIIGGYGGI